MPLITIRYTTSRQSPSLKADIASTVSDLSAEIRRQLGPLAKQADVARRAQVV